MKSIAIVTHCYCPPGVTHYAEHLRWQIASLLRCSVAARVSLFVCKAPLGEDPATDRVFDWLSDQAVPPNVTIDTIPLALCLLFRRAAGRNIVAKYQQNADAVWFTDADYSFGEGCLDAVAALVDCESSLVIPRAIWINTTHAIGDQMVEAGRLEEVPKINPLLFALKRQRIAIGGVQIIGGKVARRIGYLDRTQWVEPVDAAIGFRSCKCDVAWRRTNGLVAARLDIPNTFRIRHSTAGRDYNLGGDALGRVVW